MLVWHIQTMFMWMENSFSVWKICGLVLKWTTSSGLVWMHCLNPFSQWDSPWDETPKISPDQPIMSYTTYLYPYSRHQQLGLWIEYWHKVIQSAQNSPVHRQRSVSHHQLPTPCSDFQSEPLEKAPHTYCRMPLSLFSFCSGETAVGAKLRLRPGCNQYNVSTWIMLNFRLLNSGKKRRKKKFSCDSVSWRKKKV